MAVDWSGGGEFFFSFRVLKFSRRKMKRKEREKTHFFPLPPKHKKTHFRFAPRHLLAPRHLRRPHRAPARLGRQLRALGGPGRRQALAPQARAAERQRRRQGMRLVSRPGARSPWGPRSAPSPHAPLHALRAQVRARGQRAAAGARRRGRRAAAVGHGSTDVQAMTFGRFFNVPQLFFSSVIVGLYPSSPTIVLSQFSY